MSIGRFGWLRAILLRLRPTDGSANYVELKPSATLSTNVSLTLPDSLPGSTQLLTVTSAGVMGYSTPGGTGTVTTLSFDTNADTVFSVTNPTTTPQIVLDSQTQNRFLASPTGAAGVPNMRAIAWADVSGLAGSTASTFAAGNDSRFHTQNTDTGTTSATFQLDNGNSGVRIKHASGELQVRNSADTANANLTAANITVSGNLVVQGTTTTIDSNQLVIGDNLITLNNDFTTGSPTENAGIEVRRGGSATVTIIQWDETVDDVFVTVGSTLRRVGVVVEQTFVNGDLTAGVYTWTHNLGRQHFPVTIIDNANKTVGAEVTYSSATQATVDLTGFGTLTGTWRLIGG